MPITTMPIILTACPLDFVCSAKVSFITEMSNNKRSLYPFLIDKSTLRYVQSNASCIAKPAELGLMVGMLCG